MTQRSIEATRTWLYVPSDQPARVTKAMASGADAVIVDLEDAVAPHAKGAARTALSDWLDALPDSAGGATQPRLWVRINSTTPNEDLDVACHPLVAGICLPKTESVAAIRELDDHLTNLDRHRRAGSAPTSMMLLIETARGVIDCANLAAVSARVAILQLGELDLSADLRLPPSASAREEVTAADVPAPLRAARVAVVLASAAAGRCPPIAPVSPDVHDPNLLSHSRQLRADGFGSRAVIHPAQLAPVVEAFTPGDDELAWARRVVDAAATSTTSAGGAALLSDRMIDAPVIAQARAVLDRAN